MSFMQDSSIFVTCVHCVAKVKNPDDVILKEILAEFRLPYSGKFSPGKNFAKARANVVCIAEKIRQIYFRAAWTGRN